ncbi:hypothetical protein ASE66_25570 [Bosea sp. Root483D1]|uniref:hypothetical protein n=1 Tax=Bosea sp. Root483D1 TaxID=1736544 RepID=UPI00070D8619|nr:hypothetical protein [Bosea sp. Root483D1]KRE22563.1 hypothetical protein ASE66_25570 [Bosea sp. Root483D1]
MLLYQTDVGGFFVGQVTADESPLEPGVFLIPAGCVAATPPVVEEGQSARWDGVGWVVVEPAPPPEPPPTTVDDYRFAIQSHLDATARQRNYDGALTCSSYVNSTNPGWAIEALAFVTWRDAVWTYAYAEFGKVQSGEREQPSVAEILAELPTIVWPQ